MNRFWIWAALAIGAFLYWKRVTRVPAGMVSIGAGYNAYGGLPTVAPRAAPLGGLDPAVPSSTGYAPDRSGGNGGSGGW